jgi:hypothetical protein
MGSGISKVFCSVLCCLVFTTAWAQQSVVQGTVHDHITGKALKDATIQLSSATSRVGTTSDSLGNFSVEAPPGRYIATVTHVGYAPFREEVVVKGGKATILTIRLHEIPVTLDSIAVTAPRASYAGQVDLTMEKTLRSPANYFDPVRVLTSYPGVMTANDQSNGILIRGNSPAGLLWRLNGLDIVNPNHLANAGTFTDKPASNGGGVNILSAQVLDKTTFYAGTVPPAYGNFLSGVADLSLRAGNPRKREHTVQASLIGIDLATEGPMGKSERNSYLVNYRYSTVGLLSQMGVKFGDEDIRFHDLTFNLNFVTRRNSTFSLFGFAGRSTNVFEAKDSVDREEDKDWYDIDFKATTWGTGLRYQGSVTEKFSIAYGLAFSASDQQRDSYFNRENFRYHIQSYNATRQMTSAFVRITGKTTMGVTEMGVQASYQVDSLRDRSGQVAYAFNPCVDCEVVYVNAGKTEAVILQPYWNWRMYLSEKLVMDVGMRLVYFSDLDHLATEPRINFTFASGERSSWELSYGTTSQRPVTALAIGADVPGKPTSMNRISLAYKSRWRESVNISTEVYYQDVRKIWENTDFHFSAFNYMEGQVYPVLTATGRARNYGWESTLEKSFDRHHYLITGLSWYRSEYQDSQNQWRASRFDGKYMATVTYGREWQRTTKNKTFGLSSRVLYLGGMRSLPVDFDASEADRETRYDAAAGYTEKLGDYFRLDVRLSWTKNKTGYTRTLALDIQNLLNIENDAYPYYEFMSQSVKMKKQLGVIPILVYRIDF